jgi:hypothetical protein
MVSDVTIYEIEAEPTRGNWCIGAIGVNPGWADAAARAAIYVNREALKSRLIF